ncbi:hypothetical protein [Subtercola boreus]|uniref:hypothetical protein n=1 Tax=Subtercola boreus TaxID=120213 RepID=UPI00114D6950|nr:hypothetical protein [Subtercola boreus]
MELSAAGTVVVSGTAAPFSRVEIGYKGDELLSQSRQMADCTSDPSTIFTQDDVDVELFCAHTFLPDSAIPQVTTNPDGSKTHLQVVEDPGTWVFADASGNWSWNVDFPVGTITAATYAKSCANADTHEVLSQVVMGVPTVCTPSADITPSIGFTVAAAGSTSADPVAPVASLSPTTSAAPTTASVNEALPVTSDSSPSAFTIVLISGLVVLIVAAVVGVVLWRRKPRT